MILVRTLRKLGVHFLLATETRTIMERKLITYQKGKVINMKKKILISVVVILVALIGAGYLFLHSFSKSFEEGFGNMADHVTEENISNFQDGLKSFMGY